MTIALFSFTGAGRRLVERLDAALVQKGYTALKPEAALSLNAAAAWAFEQAQALVFVGAAGIAVRAVAPFLRSKTVDPAVIAVDEKARWVVPLVSGHIGGANELSLILSGILNAEPVITTATDSNGVFAADLWAVKNGLLIDSMEKAKRFSAALLSGETLPCDIRYPYNGALPARLKLTDGAVYPFGMTVSVFFKESEAAWLRLIPQTVYLGIGCRKGVSKDTIGSTVNAALAEQGIDPRSIAGAGTISLKKNETGLIEFCREQDWPLAVYDAPELARLTGDFSSSVFVKSVTGVDTVCERAACAAARGGSLILKKYSARGVSVAAAEMPFTLNFEQEQPAGVKSRAENTREALPHGGDIHPGRGMLDFSINISPLGVPAGVRRAARRSLYRAGCYPDRHCSALRAALARKHNFDAARIICDNGAAGLIYRIAHAIRPENALIAVPTFREYEKAFSEAGTVVHKYFLNPPHFELDEPFIERIASNTGMVVLCNPNNPTSLLIRPELLVRLVRRCEEAGAVLMIDECFNDFIDDPPAHSLTSFLDQYKNLIILKAFTKFYAMAGFRLGYCLCSSERDAGLIQNAGQAWPVSSVAMSAGVAALRERVYESRLRRILKSERARLLVAFAELGLETPGAAANFIMFKLNEQRGFHAETFAALLREEGILLRGCADFPGLDKNYYRTAIRTHAENSRLLRSLRRVKER